MRHLQTQRLFKTSIKFFLGGSSIQNIETKHFMRLILTYFILKGSIVRKVVLLQTNEIYEELKMISPIIKFYNFKFIVQQVPLNKFQFRI